MTSAGFLAQAPGSASAQQFFDDDLADVGFVMTASRLWAYEPAVHHRIFELLDQLVATVGLTQRDRGVLVASCASALGDSYCALAWGRNLAGEADPELAVAVLSGRVEGLSPRERALAGWARAVVRDPNGTSAADVQELRAAGYDDRSIFALTVFVALRLAFATVNDALGARPDAGFRAIVPTPVLDAVTFGRPIED